MALNQGKTVAHWLFPANTKFYDVLGAFNQNDAYWPTNATVEVGDSVYIYLAAPYKQIGYLCEVAEVGITPEEAIPHVRQFFREPIDHKKQPKMFMKLHCTVTFQVTDDSPLSYSQLKQNGLSGMLMGPRKLENNPYLLKYIKEVYNEI